MTFKQLNLVSNSEDYLRDNDSSIQLVWKLRVNNNVTIKVNIEISIKIKIKFNIEIYFFQSWVWLIKYQISYPDPEAILENNNASEKE